MKIGPCTTGGAFFPGLGALPLMGSVTVKVPPAGTSAVRFTDWPAITGESTATVVGSAVGSKSRRAMVLPGAGIPGAMVQLVDTALVPTRRGRPIVELLASVSAAPTAI